jgi:galactokinase/mevalonate kinase-like predicted kinase
LGGGGTDLPSYYRDHEGFLIAAAIDKYVYLRSAGGRGAQLPLCAARRCSRKMFVKLWVVTCPKHEMGLPSRTRARDSVVG